ncbi:hypothetical protein H6501_03795 [Candidatus Woesearchaeota archaeon]|nr:hypothetical protein [Candidatus Woesearchaeota archaeon]
MTLYGLDIIKEEGSGKFWLIEMNGVRAGMKGFVQVYGDERVETEVWKRVEEQYGNLTWNNGSYRRMRYKEEHPMQYYGELLLRKLGIKTRIPEILHSSKADILWVLDGSQSPECKPPFPVYRGQKSVVLNIINDDKLPHPTVNPYVQEEITGNKFLQYQVLKDSAVKDHIPFSTLIGLGANSKQDLSLLLQEYKKCIAKPILGQCGKGVRTLRKEELRKLCEDSEEIEDSQHNFLLDLISSSKIPRRLEAFIEAGEFDFELGLSLVQPFIFSRINPRQRKYSSIRAIVCNGSFVDAYRREGSSIRANLSQGAKAKPFSEQGLGEFCEEIVREFEFACSTLNPESFRRDLYFPYFERRKPELKSVTFSFVY